MQMTGVTYKYLAARWHYLEYTQKYWDFPNMDSLSKVELKDSLTRIFSPGGIPETFQEEKVPAVAADTAAV